MLRRTAWIVPGMFGGVAVCWIAGPVQIEIGAAAGELLAAAFGGLLSGLIALAIFRMERRAKAEDERSAFNREIGMMCSSTTRLLRALAELRQALISESPEKIHLRTRDCSAAAKMASDILSHALEHARHVDFSRRALAAQFSITLNKIADGEDWLKKQGAPLPTLDAKVVSIETFGRLMRDDPLSWIEDTTIHGRRT